jgi:hypothetical protein
MLLLPRQSTELQEFCIRNWGQRPDIRTKDSPRNPTQKGFKRSVSGTRDRDIYVFLRTPHSSIAVIL